MKLLPLRADDARRWNEFCVSSDDAWFWHTTQWLDYSLAYRPELAPKSVSFFGVAEGRIVAICPLIIETENEDSGKLAQFSNGGDAVAAPAFANGLPERQRKAVVAATMNEVDKLAGEHQVKRVCFRSSPVAPGTWKAECGQLNFLLRFGYLDVSLATHVIELSDAEADLLKRMRKGHRAAIKQAEKTLTCRILDAGTITESEFEKYRLLHRKAAGRVTRPLSTFCMMYEWIRQGYAILAAACLQGQEVGFALISVYKDAGYYSSGCVDPECNHLPIGHLLQWRAMQWLKQNGIRRYEIGIQHFSSLPHAVVSEKEMKISLFKRGFGGVTVPFWRSERFYDKGYYRRVMVERVEAFAEAAFEADKPVEQESRE